MIHTSADLLLAPTGSRLAAQVADDLDAVFGPTGLAVEPRRLGRARQMGMDVSRPAGGRLSSIGAVAAAGLIGLSAGVLLTHQGEAASIASSRIALASAPTPPAQVEVRPVATALARAVYAAPTPAEPFEPDPDEAPAVQAATPSPKPAAAKPRRSVKADVPTASSAARTAAARPTGCPGRADQRPCAHSDVLAADRGLRRAYARAAKAGVPRPTLVAARQRWDELRRHVPDRPERLVSGYLALSGDLAKATNVARADQGSRRYALS